MRILLLGGTGYIGSYCERMVAPRGLRILAPPRQRLDLLDHKSVSLFFGEEQPFDSVIYLSTINKNQCTSRGVAWQNVIMTKNLLSNLNRQSTLIFASSVDVYGSSPTLPVNEETPLNPESWYAESKVACEQLIGSSLTQGASRHVVLRLPGVYGNVTAGSAILDQMVGYILGQSSSFVLRDSQVLRDWVYVRDLWRFLWTLACSPPRNRSCFNVATGLSWPVEKWYKEVSLCLKGRFCDILVKRCSPCKEAYDLSFDISGLSEDFRNFHFTPRVKTFLEYCL